MSQIIFHSTFQFWPQRSQTVITSETWTTEWELWPCSGSQSCSLSVCGLNEVASVGWLYTITVPQLLWFQQGDWHFGHLHPSSTGTKTQQLCKPPSSSPIPLPKSNGPLARSLTHSPTHSPETFLISRMHGCRWDRCGLHLSLKPGTGTCARVLRIMALCEQREETFLETRWVIQAKKIRSNYLKNDGKFIAMPYQATFTNVARNNKGKLWHFTKKKGGGEASVGLKPQPCWLWAFSNCFLIQCFKSLNMIFKTISHHTQTWS